MPYKTRNLRTFRRVLAKHVMALGHLRFLVFKIGGLRPRLLVCYADDVRLKFKRMRVRDTLSGLELELQAPIVVIRDCIVELQWQHSSFVLRADDLIKCKDVCFELPC